MSVIIEYFHYYPGSISSCYQILQMLGLCPKCCCTIVIKGIETFIGLLILITLGFMDFGHINLDKN